MTATLARSARPPAPLLFAAACVAGFGLGMLGLAATLPAPRAAPLPEPGARPAAPAVEATPEAPRAPWPALFGQPAPEPAPTPVVLVAPEPEPDDAPFFDETRYLLRGVVVTEDAGWALVETEDGVTVVRPGDFLIDGEEVLAIRHDGIEIGVDGENFFIGFDENAPPPEPRDPDAGDWPDDDPSAPFFAPGSSRAPVGFFAGPRGG